VSIEDNQLSIVRQDIMGTQRETRAQAIEAQQPLVNMHDTHIPSQAKTRLEHLDLARHSGSRTWPVSNFTWGKMPIPPVLKGDSGQKGTCNRKNDRLPADLTPTNGFPQQVVSERPTENPSEWPEQRDAGMGRTRKFDRALPLCMDWMTHSLAVSARPLRRINTDL
jgi:hypothetical protein